MKLRPTGACLYLSSTSVGCLLFLGLLVRYATDDSGVDADSEGRPRVPRTFLGFKLPWEKGFKFNEKKEFPAELQERLVKALETEHTALQLNASEQARLNCRTPVARAVTQAFPRTTFFWRFNDQPFTMESTRMIYYQGTMIIQDVRVTDVGVYVCYAQYSKDEVKPLTVASIMVDGFVEDMEALHVPEGGDLTLDCHDAGLARLYGNSSVKSWWLSQPLGSGNNSWASLLNASLVTRMSNLSVNPATPDLVKNVSKEDAGVWTCVVRDVPTEREWLTSRHLVVVDPPPTRLEAAISLVKERPLQILTITGAVLSVVFLFFLAIAYRGQVTKMKAEEKLQEIQEKIRSLRRAQARADSEMERLEQESQDLLLHGAPGAQALDYGTDYTTDYGMDYGAGYHDPNFPAVDYAGYDQDTSQGGDYTSDPYSNYSYTGTDYNQSGGGLDPDTSVTSPLLPRAP